MKQTNVNIEVINKAFADFIEAETSTLNDKERYFKMLPQIISKIDQCHKNYINAEETRKSMKYSDIPVNPETGEKKELYLPVVYLYFLEPRISTETRRYNEIKDNDKLVLRKELIYGGDYSTERINIILTNRGYYFKKYTKEGDNDYACETFDNVEQLLHFFIPGYSDDLKTTRYGFVNEYYTL